MREPDLHLRPVVLSGPNLRCFFWPMLFSIGFFAVTPPDFDLWWHLQVGRDICVHHIWPSPDIYAYTTDRAWVIHSWFWDCAAYEIWSMAECVRNDWGLLSLKSFRLIIMIGFALLIYVWAKKSTRNETLALLAVLVVGVLCWDRSIRPYLLTPLFFGYIYWFCTLRTPRRWDWYALPAIMILWANIHGGFAIAAAILVSIAAAQMCVPRLAHVEPYHDRRWVRLSVTSAVLTFANPHPIGLSKRVWSASSYPTHDWLSMITWLVERPEPTISCAVVLVAVLGWWCYLHWRGKPEGKVLISGRFMADVACFLLAVLHIRFIWMLVFPLLGCPEYVRRLVPGEDKPRLIPVLVVFLLCFLWLPHFPESGVYRLPAEPVKYVGENKIAGNIFTPWHWAAYVTWMTDKQGQVFVDTRIQPFTKEMIDLALLAYSAPASFLGQLVSRGTQFIIMPQNEFTPEWNMLAEKGLIEFLQKNEYNFLARVNTDKVREVYAGTHFGAELPKDGTQFR